MTKTFNYLKREMWDGFSINEKLFMWGMVLLQILVKYLKESGNWDKVVILNGDYYENFMTVVKYVREVMAR